MIYLLKTHAIKIHHTIIVLYHIAYLKNRGLPLRGGGIPLFGNHNTTGINVAIQDLTPNTPACWWTWRLTLELKRRLKADSFG